MLCSVSSKNATDCMLWLCVTPGCDNGAFGIYRRKPRNDTQPMEIPPIFGSYGTIRLLIVERVTNHKDESVPSLTTHLPYEHNSRWQRRMGAPLRFAVTRHKETERGGSSAAIFVCVCVSGSIQPIYLVREERSQFVVLDLCHSPDPLSVRAF